MKSSAAGTTSHVATALLTLTIRMLPGTVPYAHGQCERKLLADDDHGFSSGSAHLFDVNCGLAVSPDPLIAGQDATFTCSNVNPGRLTFLACSLMGRGSTYVAPLHVTLGLDHPFSAGTPLVSDASGMVQWILTVPDGASGRDIRFQPASGISRPTSSPLRSVNTVNHAGSCIPGSYC